MQTQTPLDDGIAAQVWDCTPDEYHADTSRVSRSMLWDLEQSPALFHGRYVTKTVPPKESDAFDFGTAFHDMCAQPRFVCDRDSFRRWTVARWERVEIPDDRPQFVSGSGSLYWFTGKGVTRLSDHWGQVGNCVWELAPDGSNKRAGYCDWSAIMPNESFIPIPDVVLDARGAKNGGAYKAWLAQQPVGRPLLKSCEYMHLPRMLASLWDEPAAAAIMAKDSHRERGIVWTDPDTGIECRCRLDVWPLDNSWIGDLKTTVSVDPRKFAQQVLAHGLHFQAAFYQMGVAALTGELVPFVFIAIEKQPPYSVRTFDLDEPFMDRARGEVRRALANLERRTREDDWHLPYRGRVIPLSLPCNERYLDAYRFEDN